MVRTILIKDKTKKDKKDDLKEGINLFLAGFEKDVQEFLQYLRTDPRLKGFRTKDSWSASQPFRKLLVKIKK